MGLHSRALPLLLHTTLAAIISPIGASGKPAGGQNRLRLSIASVKPLLLGGTVAQGLLPCHRNCQWATKQACMMFSKALKAGRKLPWASCTQSISATAAAAAATATPTAAAHRPAVCLTLQHHARHAVAQADVACRIA